MRFILYGNYCGTVGSRFEDARILFFHTLCFQKALMMTSSEMSKMGANVVFFEQEKDGWPFLKRHERLDQPKASTITRLLLRGGRW